MHHQIRIFKFPLLIFNFFSATFFFPGLLEPGFWRIGIGVGLGMGKGDGLRAIWVEAFSHDLGFKEV